MILSVKTEIFIYNITIVETSKFEYRGEIKIQNDNIGKMECQFFGEWYIQLQFYGLNSEFMQTEYKKFEKALNRELKILHK